MVLAHLTQLVLNSGVRFRTILGLKAKSTSNFSQLRASPIDPDKKIL